MQRAQRFEAAREALTGDMHEITVDCVARGNIELRERRGYFFQVQTATLGDVEGAGQDFGGIFEYAIHFVVVLDEELGAIELHTRGVVDGLAGLDAEHDVLGVSVVLAEIVAVVGGDEWKAQIFFQLEEAGMDLVLHR